MIERLLPESDLSDASPDISPGRPRIASTGAPANVSTAYAQRYILASGLRGFWAVLDGHLGHARLANRMVYWLRRSSPIWLAQNDPKIRVLMKYPG
jgi:hypothetical protein